MKTIILLLCVAAYMVQDCMAQDSLKMPEDFANMILKSVAEKSQKDSIQEALKRRWIPGTPAPDFKYRDINGKTVSLKDLKGKYVYIDVWATWCGPCKGEIPHLQRLEEKMHGRKIVFVSISCDANRLAWERMVNEKKLGGIQLQIEGDNAFLSAFGVEGIPRFILLDKKGRVVNAWMSRPSEPETEKVLLGLKGI